MSTRYAVAPAAPGALGADVPAPELLAYLDAMLRWRDQRRTELEALDRAAMELAEPQERAAVTPDVTLSMTLWQAVADRLELLLATWDSGRVGENERRRITTLVWGTLEQPGSRAGAQALAVSLPEACRLSDSLATSLRSRLRLDGSDPRTTERLTALRAQVARIADQVALVPESRRSSAAQAHALLERRVEDVTERLRRGADVGGFLGPLEAEAATVERDLIVAASARAHAKADHAQATREVAELSARGEAVLALARRARELVTPAPTLGVPDVTQLGAVPSEPEELTAYLSRLERVDRALGVAQTSYAQALARREELALRARTVREALQGDADATAAMASLAQQAQALLEARPTDLTRLEALVQAQETFARTMGVRL
ncbi:hypothetical protein [Ornithinimicrobium pekingense]|uniref:Uncharacterized protein n=1 Tax=Ornithinimicrobium pekingense TaxID=384677 RepID=A0ABQ2F789_9MICO|nr:hypothetical protein [Ornithinimicrobium pekingense]GGK68238.1 hypothetical protein GCM10011509_15790 [Ornithinimicrobium pekingense]